MKSFQEWRLTEDKSNKTKKERLKPIPISSKPLRRGHSPHLSGADTHVPKPNKGTKSQKNKKAIEDFNEEVNSRGLARQQKESFKIVYDALKQFSDASDWYIHVEWGEPDDQMNWKKYDAYGPFNNRFFKWLNEHWDYWQDRAAVSVRLREIHRSQKGKSRTW